MCMCDVCVCRCVYNCIHVLGARLFTPHKLIPTSCMHIHSGYIIPSFNGGVYNIIAAF